MVLKFIKKFIYLHVISIVIMKKMVTGYKVSAL